MHNNTRFSFVHTRRFFCILEDTMTILIRHFASNWIEKTDFNIKYLKIYQNILEYLIHSLKKNK